MKSRSRIVVPLLALAAVFCVPPCAASPTEFRVEFDPQRTKVTFTLDAVGHTVKGEASLARGEFRFDSETGETSGELVVDAASAVTGHRKRDKKMHRDVLESGEHGEIILRPERFEGEFVAEGTFEIVLSGAFEIHGGSHPVEIEMTVTTEGSRLRAAGAFLVPFVEWGMEDPSFLFLRVAKEVEVFIDASGTFIHD